MKTRYVSIALLALCLISFSSFSQTENDEPLLGLPGDDLDLYAVLDLFQKSKTIEAFEKDLNSEKEGIVNLDLNNDSNVDFIKVVTKKDGDDFLFILQDPITEKETQDVAVMTVSKDAAGKVTMQIIGDEELYGKDYVVEPVSEPAKSVTSNPAYVGNDPVTVNVAATTEVIVVQSAPVVQYVYSPVYVPYVPPYYYGYYPHYWRPFAVVGVSIYRQNHFYRHSYYHGGGGHTSVNININNHNSYNNYNKNTRNVSRTVNNNVRNGNFKTSGQRGSRTSSGKSNRVSNRSSSSNRTVKSSSKSKVGNTSKRTSSYNKSSTSLSKSNRSPSHSSTNRSSASRSMGASRSSGGAFGGRSGGGGGRRR
jgi:hypothetical protein